MEALWALAGVALGFLLSEASQTVRAWHQRRRAARQLRAELESLAAQISQKRDVVAQAIGHLRSHRFIPTLSIPAVAMGYREFFPQLVAHLTPVERNCVHNIYERVLLADRVLDAFERNFLDALREGLIDDPYSAHADRFSEIDGAYLVAQDLIAGYLAGKPEDVYQVQPPKPAA